MFMCIGDTVFLVLRRIPPFFGGHWIVGYPACWSHSGCQQERFKDIVGERKCPL